MIALSVTGLGYAIGDRVILEDIGFALNEGDRLGIVGVNGAGKTTLFRLLAGEYTPTSGAVFVARERTVGWLRQDEATAKTNEEVTLLDYMLAAFPRPLKLESEIAELEQAIAEAELVGDEGRLLSLSARLATAHEAYAAEGGGSYRARSRSMLSHLGFPEEEQGRAVSSLSGGQHTRLALARLLAEEPDILLLDEPTNHLDLDALLWLEDFLAGYPKTVLVISHDRYFLDKVTSKTLMISYTHARLYHGNYTVAKQMQAADEASQERAYREQQKEIARIEANIAFQRRCGQAHNFVTIRAKQKQLDRMVRVEAVKAPPREVHFSFQSDAPSGNEVLTLSSLAFSYGQTPLLRSLSCLFRKDERVLLLGANGCGKSTLMKLLAGKLTPSGGSITYGEGVTIGYYDQEVASFHADKTVFEELHDEYPKKTVGEIRSALALFLFGAEDVDKPISSLSGGEKARLTLAKLMLKPCNLLLLDEPTNHLDIGSREALETALIAFEGTVIAVSHDRYFIDRIATRLVELSPTAERGCLSFVPYEDELPYACYLRTRDAVRAEAAPTTAPVRSEGKEAYARKKQQEAEERALRRRREMAERRIPELEAAIEEKRRELFGEAASDYVRAAEIEAEITAAEEELLSLYELIM